MRRITDSAQWIESDRDEVSTWAALQQEFRVSLPAFLSSLFVHLILLILLAIISLPVLSPEILDLTFSVGQDDLPSVEDLLDDSFEVDFASETSWTESEELVLSLIHI